MTKLLRRREHEVMVQSLEDFPANEQQINQGDLIRIFEYHPESRRWTEIAFHELYVAHDDGVQKAVRAPIDETMLAHRSQTNDGAFSHVKSKAKEIDSEQPPLEIETSHLDLTHSDHELVPVISTADNTNWLLLESRDTSAVDIAHDERYSTPIWDRETYRVIAGECPPTTIAAGRSSLIDDLRALWRSSTFTMSMAIGFIVSISFFTILFIASTPAADRPLQQAPFTDTTRHPEPSPSPVDLIDFAPYAGRAESSPGSESQRAPEHDQHVRRRASPRQRSAAGRPPPSKRNTPDITTLARQCHSAGDHPCCIKLLEHSRPGAYRLLASCYAANGQLDAACRLARAHAADPTVAQFLAARCPESD